jgi:hypothetical protein
MINSTISDETLMALADGELSQTEAVAVRSRITVDPVMAARFAAFVETRMLLQEPGGATAEATPRRLVDAILQHDSEPRGGRASARDVIASPRPAGNALWRLPIAAAIAFTLGGLVGSFVATRDASRNFAAATDIFSVPAVRSAVAEALDRLPSGGEVAWSDQSLGLSGRVLVVATQRLNDATACREYDISYRGPSSGSVVAASCRRGDAWRTEIAVFRTAPEQGFTPARGVGVVEQYLADLGSSGPLSADDEKVAIAQGWRALR